jgi:hypothetical protein
LEELSRQCSSELDRIALYGNPALNPNQPRGVKFTVGIWNIAIGVEPPWEDLVEAERLTEIQNVSMSNFGYIVSPTTKKVLRNGPRWPNADTTVWEALEDKFHSSNEVEADAGEIFFGAWQQLTLGIWGADLIINPFSRAGVCSGGVARQPLLLSRHPPPSVFRGGNDHDPAATTVRAQGGRAQGEQQQGTGCDARRAEQAGEPAGARGRVCDSRGSGQPGSRRQCQTRERPLPMSAPVPTLYDHIGRPIAAPASVEQPRNEVSEGKDSERSQMRQDPSSWHVGGPYALGAPSRPRVLPPGVSIVYDERVDAWCLRDEFREEPVIGWSRFHTTVATMADGYVAELGRRSRREQSRRSRN